VAPGSAGNRDNRGGIGPVRDRRLLCRRAREIRDPHARILPGWRRYRKEEGGGGGARRIRTPGAVRCVGYNKGCASGAFFDRESSPTRQQRAISIAVRARFSPKIDLGPLSCAGRAANKTQTMTACAAVRPFALFLVSIPIRPRARPYFSNDQACASDQFDLRRGSFAAMQSGHVPSGTS
jgi:hypothetical protein